MDRLEQFLNFAEQSPTAFHAAAGFREMLREAGFSETTLVKDFYDKNRFVFYTK